MCPPEVFQGLAKKGMEKADDRFTVLQNPVQNATQIA